MTKEEAIRRLYGLIADINAEEVADHIKDGVSLCDWTNAWRCEAKDALRVLAGTADTPQTDCEACELDGKADVCKICRVSNYEPQTDSGWK